MLLVTQRQSKDGENSGVTDIILINIFTSRNQVTEKPVLNHLIFNSLLPVGDTSQLFQHIPRLQSHPRTTEPSAPALRMLKIPGPSSWQGHEIPGLCSWKAPHFLTLWRVYVHFSHPEARRQLSVWLQIQILLEGNPVIRQLQPKNALKTWLKICVECVALSAGWWA